MPSLPVPIIFYHGLLKLRQEWVTTRFWP